MNDIPIDLDTGIVEECYENLQRMDNNTLNNFQDLMTGANIFVPWGKEKRLNSKFVRYQRLYEVLKFIGFDDLFDN